MVSFAPASRGLDECSLRGPRGGSIGDVLADLRAFGGGTLLFERATLGDLNSSNFLIERPSSPLAPDPAPEPTPAEPAPIPNPSPDATERGDFGNDSTPSDGNDNVHGNAGNDALLGGAGDDYIEGGAGNDRLFGQDGNDGIAGGDDDRIFGEGGNDTINDGAGADSVDGGEGDDAIAGGAGNDRLTGGAEGDTFVARRHRASGVPAARSTHSRPSTFAASPYGPHRFRRVPHRLPRTVAGLPYGRPGLQAGGGERRGHALEAGRPHRRIRAARGTASRRYGGIGTCVRLCAGLV